MIRWIWAAAVMVCLLGATGGVVLAGPGAQPLAQAQATPVGPVATAPSPTTAPPTATTMGEVWVLVGLAVLLLILAAIGYVRARMVTGHRPARRR